MKPEGPTCRDPHHDGFWTWLWDGQNLYIRSAMQFKWTKVKKLHPTPARIAMLNKLMNGETA